MKFGICLLSVIPVRSDPSDKAEIVTQLLFGELVVVNESHEKWMKIRIVYDNYEGWVDPKQITVLSENEFYRLSKSTVVYSKDLVEVVQDGNQKLIPILFGSTLRNVSDGKFHIHDISFSFSGQLTDPGDSFRINKIIEDALLFLNAPYLWGGKTPFGVDCSGLTQIVYKVNGIELLRDAAQQATQGETISLIDEAEPGDLVFFDNEEGKIVHVGIIIEKNKIIHASGKVRIDAIDHHGIYNLELQKYTHNLRLIKRFI
jgi:gamma-D-glutamyl-L-lysine dipeptidyl-peptidase